MINYGQMVLEFGNGDIGISGGNSLQDSKLGVVVFNNIEPREIGLNSGFDEEAIYPLIMTFTKKESIDVLIGELLRAKKSMEEKIDKNTHVYCTNCIHIQSNLNCIKNNGDNSCEYCPCDGCECVNPEDSTRFEERYNYKIK